MADVADYTQAVNVTGGSVSITGPVTVQITGTPTVQITGNPQVQISNTPAVTINSGTVTATISGTPSINIQSQSVSLNVVLPQALQATINVTAGGSQNVAVPTGCHALGIAIGAAALSSLKVIGHVSGVNYWPGVGLGSRAMGAGSHVIVPVFSALDTSVDITWTFISNTTIWVLAILDTEAVVPVPDQVGQVPGFMGVTLYDATVSTGSSLIGQKAMSNSIPVALASDQSPTRTPFHGYDATGFSDPGAASQASVVLAATPGKTYSSPLLEAAQGTNAATAVSTHVNLLDGVTKLATFIMAAPATAFQECPKVQVQTAYIGTSGNSMTWQFDVAQGTAFQTISIGAYLS